MKKHLNTLFVTTQGAYLAKEGESIAVRIEKEVRLRLPIHTISGIVCFGNVGCSPFLIRMAALLSPCRSCSTWRHIRNNLWASSQ